MSRQRDPNRYPITAYFPMDDAKRVYTKAEGRRVKNHKMALSECLCEIVHDGVKTVKPSEGAEKWANEQLNRLGKLRKKMDKRTANGEFKEGDLKTSHARAAARVKMGLTTRPRPVKDADASPVLKREKKARENAAKEKATKNRKHRASAALSKA